MKEYQFIEEKEIKELETMARVYEHKKTGAKVLCLENKDDNKVFSIAFRTPAEDSTGVAHITEHSVLCGSKKFPLKDPFVELVKGSLKTFLNAMTYPDKTVYPVASQNDKDFQNLMDVYLDAVFHPNCLDNYRTFLQEGWHYTLDKEGRLCYSGVVYNEMRGAFSDPESVLERYTFHSLFPDTTYGNESGGDPEDIPKLTYDAFKAFHQRFYHPSNSFIILYGDMNMEEKLNWIDEAYLQEFERISPNSEIAGQQPFGKMVEESHYYPISEKDSSENKAYLSYNFVLDAGQDAKKSMAFSYLDHALLSGPGAVLKQKLLEAGLGEDVFGGYSDGILQHYFSVISKNVSEERAGEFLQLIQDCFLDAAENGLDHKTILAAIHHDAFQYKEADYGSTPKGLVYSISALDSWLYGGKPWLYLEAEALYKELMEEVDKGYFEKLLKEYFLNNPHSSLLRLLPRKGMTEQKEEKLSEELQARWQAFSPEEKEQIKKVKEELTLYQQTENTEEALKTLPVLSRKDIKREAESYPYQEESLGNRKLILVPGESKGVLYLRLQFHTDGLSEEELSYLSFLKTCLAYMDTENYRFQDFNSEIYLHTGGFSVDLTAYPDFVEKDRYTGVLALDFKLLQGELKNAVEYLEEMLFRTVYQEEKRLSEILLEAKSRERMRLEGSGHSYAVTRAMSAFSPSSHFQEQIKGIVYLHFLEELEEDFRKNPKALGEKLTALSKKIFSGERLL
ncbi:insulinase family protein, partial [Oribacterium sinus]